MTIIAGVVLVVVFYALRGSRRARDAERRQR
jgi:hypothetical protein